ncbi:hypothetical protein ACWT_1947 [Actinoplanes sp. SE50]|uniref:RDD family protein n=1 Tax=unclassified Actinoplanes TaxID=2626549 RepID=UPI00023EC074|nr:MULTISPECIES: RDD family protein [unclassified Actinoplanes]AEV82966.1 putative membrane protein [Actinoplanes sp. SE50/110]ATO81362.1 hypothetical protein ACWT_1947 [Actinoplanes sp. SE50]SLL98769.1 uncharacterized protein ACSP50_1996 [Actinoplanes sp. SE50/110]
MSYPPPNDPYGQPQQQAYGQPIPQQPYGGQQPYGAPAPGYGPAVTYASWGARVGAYLVDMLVILPFAIVALFFRPTVDPVTLQTHFSPMYFIILLLAVVVSFYNRVFLDGKGQSWGKKALGIRLVDAATGQPIGAGKAFLRGVAHFVDFIICYVGFLFPLWDEKKQTIADKIVGTVVVK